MNRSSIVAFASLAALFGVAAGCDSSTPGAHSAGETCARLSACGLTIDIAGSAGESFGSCVYFVGAVGLLAPSEASGDKRTESVFTCISAASTCDEIRACSRPTSAQAAVCDTTAQDTCSGNTLVNCSMNGTSREVTAFDCAAAGLVCGASADGADCGIASCDPASMLPSCNGDLLVTCETQGNVLVSRDCRREGQACRSNSAGIFDCVGDTPCDPSTFQTRCEGATEVMCWGSTESRFDCSRVSGMTCSLGVIGDATTMGCTPIEQQCIVGASESCQDGVISYCNLGLPATFDCRSVGLSGCTTQAIGTRTIAGCVP